MPPDAPLDQRLLASVPARAEALLRAQRQLEPSFAQLQVVYRQVLRDGFAELFAAAPCDIRALGHAYERALEHELHLDAGELGLRPSSGLRKQHGAYFSKPFVIEHLLDHALEPALTRHVQQVQRLAPAQRDAALFDFRVADLAMGAGYFLLAALERIEARFGPLLTQQPGLRERIARQCIHGIDIDPDVVAIARMSLAAHLGTPAKPPSWLTEQLVVGDALLGISTWTRAEELLAGRLAQLPTDARARATLFDLLIAERVAGREAAAHVQDGLARIAEDPAHAWQSPPHRAALALLAPLEPLHLPIAFPQVFDGPRPGFDVILGNPPWAEAQLDEDRFWTRHAPGLHSLPQARQEARKAQLRAQHPELAAALQHELERLRLHRRALVSGDYPGIGDGDPDTYKAFTWRCWQLLAEEGTLGLVLPRSAFCAKGSTQWRRELLAAGQFLDLTFLTNNKRWVFDDVHPQYTIALASLTRTCSRNRTIPIRGPHASMQSYRESLAGKPHALPLPAILHGTDTASFPLLRTPTCAAIWTQMRKSPRLDHDDGSSWRARPHRELDATNDKPLMHFGEPPDKDWWPIYKGESFDLWRADSQTYYAWIDPQTARARLQAKRSKANKRGPFAEFTPSWRNDPRTLPCLHPRIAFRDVSRATDSRTIRAALLPPQIALTNKAPYLLWPRGDERDQAYLLGVLCSIPLDWFARTHVEVSLNYHVFNPLPIPRPSRDDPRWQRVVALAGRLAAQDHRVRGWAERVGVACGRLPDDEREDMLAELDAVVARLYGLCEAQLVHLFEHFHPTWDPGPRLDAARRHFH